MASRPMFCARCRQTDVPDVQMPGSDRLELAAWCCLVVPGLLYLAWRHASRRRICAHCGSAEVLRESRAARRRRKADEPQPASRREPRMVFAAPRVVWLAAPSVRLGRTLRGGALAVAMAGFAVVSLDVIQVEPARAPAAPAAASDTAKLGRAQRQRECEKLCREVHRGWLRGQTECLQGCVERFDAETFASRPAPAPASPIAPPAETAAPKP